MDEPLIIFDCHVLSIGRKYFWARMMSRRKDVDDYVAKIPIFRVIKRDRNVFQVGAIFTLRAGHRGAVLKFSHRRWTKAELAAVNRRAERLTRWRRLSERLALVDEGQVNE